MTKAEREHVKRLEQYVKELERLYVKAVNEAALSGASLPKFDKSKPFAFADHPAVDKRIQKAVKQLHDSFVKLMEKYITTEWGKGAGLVDDAVAGTLGDEFVVEHNRSGAAAAFIKRKENGMNLSQRVWKYVDQFKQEMEMGIDLGLRNGQSAAEMSRDLRKYLRDPNMLFRRVSDEHGNLHLSQRAKAYHPGQGIYRSSYKNAMRLARTEINMAYRTAGHDAAQDEDMIVGIEIHLSNNHNCLGIPNGEFYDICDVLAGKYPKDFKFVGWHPNCRCYPTFILMTDEELKARRKALLNGEEPPKIKSKNEITDVPENFKKWLKTNKTRIAKAKSLPYFMRDNEKYSEVIKPHKVVTSGYTGTKLGRSANKAAIKVYSDIPAPILSQEVQKNTIDIANVLSIKYQKAMTFLEADEGRANINFGKGFEYSENCQIAVVVHEARLRGLNVTATGYDRSPDSVSYKLGEHFQDIWVSPKTNRIPTPSILREESFELILSKLDKSTKAIGRYHIGINMQNSGHIITAERLQNGQMVFYDAQSGSFLKMEEYNDKGVDYIEVLKVDKLLLKIDLFTAIVQTM